ncbi:uncharacterized protein F5Z01DRAFT_61869 [Emericellopsis atlantica]|uniref:Uncharacterized protein n=1 Tax=Emericellopsis atlantica TaxID=2614577 RepID=A0A9P7ZN24_9HYPO|nr:uncharacterized protein F5Z01DRAFT_61869 [Emericellopsis atlantica]KAG9254951.1 hypothetical protein F5Z01DRAFT_61869 [Emericellopsis atlantica]
MYWMHDLLLCLLRDGAASTGHLGSFMGMSLALSETCIDLYRLRSLGTRPCLGLPQGTLLRVDLRARSLAARDCRYMLLVHPLKHTAWDPDDGVCPAVCWFRHIPSAAPHSSDLDTRTRDNQSLWRYE